ncbi:MAG: hypothetical protein M3022_13045, partial [Actinomycetota bacterium]|nr:hypothetical protein [Actinomycetota bacterium]
MRRSDGYRVGATLALALAVTDGARRLLTPRERPINPAAGALGDHFSPEEIARGQRFARPQRALGLATAAIDLAAITTLTVWPPRWLRRAGARPLAGGAAAAAALSAGVSLPTLPLA